MGVRHRTANEAAYPRALETAEARLVADRRAALEPTARSDKDAGTPAAEDAPRSILDEILRRAQRFRRSGDRRPADRATLSVDTPESPHAALPEDAVGFGLSGGGIRSATFSLGIFQALAGASLLRRVDFLS